MGWEKVIAKEEETLTKDSCPNAPRKCSHHYQPRLVTWQWDLAGTGGLDEA